MKRSGVLFLALALAACESESPTVVTTEAAPGSPAFSRSEAGSPIPGRYIVVFNAGVADAPGLARTLTAAHRGTLHYTYEAALRGFAASLPEAAVDALGRNPNVAYVEQDQVITLNATQSNATWGIDRVDQRDLPLSGTYVYNATGAGVNAYIIDTGIRYSHSEFTGRMLSGYDAIDGGTPDDCNGHGTHVAGTVGGAKYGVAKGVKLVGVRVLDCRGSGTTSGVIAGVDWVTANHVKPAVANMSLGGGASSTLDNAVANSISKGVVYAIAAGNGDFLGRPLDACTQSPARVSAALTVGSTTSSDSESSFSNYGTCVDILAPGSSITSAWYQSDTQTNTISGTSMATPHVAGAAALYLEGSPGASPSQVANALVSNGTPNTITLHSRSRSYGTPNLFLYTGFIGGGSTPANQAPTASFTKSCNELSCTFTDTSTDSDGNVVGWSWSFGDGSTSTAQHPSKTYAAGGTYTVTLTVTDNAGATGTTSQNVTVSSTPPVGGITLNVTGYKVKGVQQADLTWSGAASTSVDIFRDGSRIATGTANDGAYTDNIGQKGGGSYIYKVCEAGTNTCSPNVTVTF